MAVPAGSGISVSRDRNIAVRFAELPLAEKFLLLIFRPARFFQVFKGEFLFKCFLIRGMQQRRDLGAHQAVPGRKRRKQRILRMSVHKNRFRSTLFQADIVDTEILFSHGTDQLIVVYIGLFPGKSLPHGIMDIHDRENDHLIVFAVIKAFDHFDQIPAELSDTVAAIDAGQFLLVGTQRIPYMFRAYKVGETLPVIRIDGAAFGQLLHLQGKIRPVFTVKPGVGLQFQDIVSVRFQIYPEDLAVCISCCLQTGSDSYNESRNGVLPQGSGGHHIYHAAEDGIVADGTPFLPVCYCQKRTVDA